MSRKTRYADVGITGLMPSHDLDAPLIGAFLTHLEEDRGNSVRTRNNRLAAIHSLYRYAALRHPEHAQTIARVMAIPTKRYQHEGISYLDPAEIKALLAAPDRSRWLGRRDHALLLTMIQTGVRVSELTTLRVRDVNLAAAEEQLPHGAHRPFRGCVRQCSHTRSPARRTSRSTTSKTEREQRKSA